MSDMTDRQLEVLRCIRERLEATGYPPTIRELGDALSIRSTNGVNDHLKALERKGYVERGTSKSRALTLTDAGFRATGGPVGAGAAASSAAGAASSSGRVVRLETETVGIPLLGRIAAGVPIDALEHAEEVLQVDAGMLGRVDGGEVFALRVEGDSMIEDGILSGDIIFVRKQATARRGETVAVFVDGAATVKRYYPEGSTVRLQPANESMEPIILRPGEATDVAILGKVVGLYRRIDF